MGLYENWNLGCQESSRVCSSNTELLARISTVLFEINASAYLGPESDLT